ncbi:hypothetical protein Bca101_032813 [Brassica carinata]
MAEGDDSFSKSIEQENPMVPPPRPRRETPTASHPPRETNLTDERKQSLINSLRSRYLTEQEMETRLQPLSNIMTSSEEEDVALFQEVISKLTGSELWWMAYLMNSNFDHYFLEIARNRIGSIRLRTLFGKSDDADSFFLGTILRHFFHVMADKEASYAAIHGMRVFNQRNKMQMYDQILHHAIPLARDRYGSIKLRAIISDDDFAHCRNRLLGVVAFNALLLSYDAYGNSVVQHVLNLNNLRCTCDIALSLRGHYVELSFTHGLKTMEIPLQGTNMHGWLRSQDNGDATTRDKHAWWVKVSKQWVISLSYLIYHLPYL